MPIFKLFFFFTAAENDQEFSQVLKDILTDSETEELKDLKMSATVYGKQFFRKIKQIGYDAVDVPKTIQHMGNLYECMTSKNLDLKSKLILSDSF